MIQVFPYAVAALQLCAAGVYVWHADYRLGVIWAGVAMSNLALAGIR